MVELTSGSILIDGVDLASIGLKTLRSALGIVPQDALLWSGKVCFCSLPLRPLLYRQRLKMNACIAATRPPGPTGNAHGSRAQQDPPTVQPGWPCGRHTQDQARLAKFQLDAAVQDKGSNLNAENTRSVAFAKSGCQKNADKPLAPFSVLVRNSRFLLLERSVRLIFLQPRATSSGETAESAFLMCTASSVSDLDVSTGRVAFGDAGGFTPTSAGHVHR